jgi:Kef-type K+ transport system membrane component KefB
MLALTCAAVDDVTAWCALALVVGVVKSQLGPAMYTAGLSVAYVLFMWFLVRPIVCRFAERVERNGSLSQSGLAWTLLAALASAFATDVIGVHALFGAFLFGACIPHNSLLAKQLRHRMEDLVVVLLLPAFFVLTGMRTQVGLIHGTSQVLFCGLIVLVACAGKFGGSTLAARVAGISWRDSTCIGALMNTRGLMELVVLNIGLDLGVISPRLFTMLVLMAVITTVMTSPLLSLFEGRSQAAIDEVLQTTPV